MKRHFYINIFRTAIFTIVCVLGGILLLPVLPTKTWFTSYTIISGSMAPIIPAGSVVLVEKTKNISLGDIVAFTQPTEANTTIVHRIIQQNIVEGSSVYTTKGDNNNATDSWVLKNSQILGKVVLSIPLIGYLQTTIQKPVGFLIVIGLPLFYFAYKNIMLIGSGFKELKGKKKKNRLMRLIFIGAGLLIMITLLERKSALALFSTQAVISNISLHAVSVLPTPSIIPTPTKTTGGGIVIDISGNGAGSNNQVEIDINNTTTVTQSNTTIINTQQSSTANSGGNVIQ